MLTNLKCRDSGESGEMNNCHNVLNEDSADRLKQKAHLYWSAGLPRQTKKIHTHTHTKRQA